MSVCLGSYGRLFCLSVSGVTGGFSVCLSRELREAFMSVCLGSYGRLFCLSVSGVTGGFSVCLSRELREAFLSVCLGSYGRLLCLSVSGVTGGFSVCLSRELREAFLSVCLWSYGRLFCLSVSGVTGGFYVCLSRELREAFLSVCLGSYGRLFCLSVWGVTGGFYAIVYLFWIVMSVSPVYSSSWPRQEGFRICHININHVINKIDEISHILFSNNLDIFGVRESRLNVNNNDNEIQIPCYFAERIDSSFPNHTGLCVFIKCDIQYTLRKDLESDELESLWIELQLPLHSVFIGFISRNPRDRVVWEDQFCDMLDSVVSLNKEYLLLGDFNFDI